MWGIATFIIVGYHEVNGRIIRGVDWAISGSHWPKTHGSQSPVMTICEKYVWQARNHISGFLADRLMYIDDDDASYANDYGLLDDFLIPALEIGQIDPNSMNDLCHGRKDMTAPTRIIFQR